MDARGRSLLYVAARAADPAAVKRALILVNAETASARTASGKTALFAAARGGCREIVEILAKRADADPNARANDCLLYTSPSPRDQRGSRMPSSA